MWFQNRSTEFCRFLVVKWTKNAFEFLGEIYKYLSGKYSKFKNDSFLTGRVSKSVHRFLNDCNFRESPVKFLKLCTIRKLSIWIFWICNQNQLFVSFREVIFFQWNSKLSEIYFKKANPGKKAGLLQKHVFWALHIEVVILNYFLLTLGLPVES